MAKIAGPFKDAHGSGGDEYWVEPADIINWRIVNEQKGVFVVRVRVADGDRVLDLFMCDEDAPDWDSNGLGRSIFETRQGARLAMLARVGQAKKTQEAE